MAGISDDVENLRVNRTDFMQAFDEVQPAFGVSEEELQQVIQNGIIHYDASVDVRLPFLKKNLDGPKRSIRNYFVRVNCS
jgi:vesicle-fusing ATPase